MAVTATAPVPYAPPSAVLEVVTRYRSRGLPTPINTEVLGRAGVSDSLIPRTLQALQTLDLIDDKSMPTATLESLRRSPEGEYRQRLVEWLNGAYADVLNFVDPATADEVAVRDAFRNYNPVGQQSRMVTLFLGLYAAAGIRPEKSVQPRQQRAVQPRPRPANKPFRAKPGGRKPTTETPSIPEPLAGLLSRLPTEDSGWTKADRDRFFNTFGTLLDFCFPIVEPEPSEMESTDDEESAPETKSGRNGGHHGPIPAGRAR